MIMNRQQFEKWQIKEGLTIYNARTQLISTTDILAHIIRDRDLAVFILDSIDFDQLKNITIPEITSILIGKIGKTSLNDLIAEQIVSAIELGRRVNLPISNNNAELGNPIVAKVFLKDKFSDISGYEELIAIFLNSSLKLIKWEIIFRGTIRTTTISSREILIRALRYNAESIIIAHNHPGGRIGPTEEDRSVTHIIKKGCSFLDLRFIDHLIFTERTCYSIVGEKEV